MWPLFYNQQKAQIPQINPSDMHTYSKRKSELSYWDIGVSLSRQKTAEYKEGLWLDWGGGIRHNARFIVFAPIFMKMNMKEQRGRISQKPL